MKYSHVLHKVDEEYHETHWIETVNFDSIYLNSNQWQAVSPVVTLSFMILNYELFKKYIVFSA